MYRPKRVGELDAREEEAARWTRCGLSGEPLGGESGREETVACALGGLYNREAVVAALLAERASGSSSAGPRLPPQLGLKRLTTLRLTPAEEGPDRAGAGDVARRGLASARHVCPVYGTPLGRPGARFVALRKTGVVVSERAVREATDLVREVTGLGGAGPIAPDDLLPLHGAPAEREALAAAHKDDLERVAAKKMKKTKPGGAGGRPAGEGALGVGPRGARVAKGRGAGAAGAAGRWLAKDNVPAGADPETWSSIFRGDRGPEKESYTARGTFGGRGQVG